MSLDRVVQNDFSAGIVDSVAPELIPPNGSAFLDNLMLDEDGALHKRGGSVALATSAPFTPIYWHLTARLGRGGPSGAPYVTLAFGDTQVAAASGGNQLTAIGTYNTTRTLKTPVTYGVMDGIVYLGNPTLTSSPYAWAGSTSAVNYSTGTLALTNASTNCTLTGGAWPANIENAVLVISGEPYAVESRFSDTLVSLKVPWRNPTASGVTYSAQSFAYLSGSSLVGYGFVASAGRLVSWFTSRVAFTKGYDVVGGASLDTEIGDYHQIPGDPNVRACYPLDTDLLVFTDAGVWIISNFAYDLTDDYGNPQQSLRELYPGLVLKGTGSGIVGYRDSLVVPAQDGVWLVSRNGLQLLSASLKNTWLNTVQLGSAATLRNHYLLPVLSDGSGIPDRMLVCRLDRPFDLRGQTAFAWTALSGQAARTGAVTAVTYGNATNLEGVGYASGRRMNLGSFFARTGTGADFDGTAISATLQSRDFTTGDGNLNTIRRARLRYEMAGSASPTITGDIATAGETGYRSMARSFTDVGPANTAEQPYTWATAERARRVRFRFQSSSLTTKLVIRGIELFVRSSPKDR